MDPVICVKSANRFNSATKAFVEGVIVIRHQSLVWEAVTVSDTADLPSLCLHFSEKIELQRSRERPSCRITVEGSAYVFMFGSIPEREYVVETIRKLTATTPDAVREAAAMAEAADREAGQYTSRIIAGLSYSERMEVLTANSDVLESFKALVMTGLLHENDFWAASSISAAAVGHRASHVGLANTMVKPEVTKDPNRQNLVVDIRITPQQRRQIFAERPAIRKVFEENVPSRYTADDFWRLYLKHQEFKQMQRENMAAGKSTFIPDAAGEIFRDIHLTGSESSGDDLSHVPPDLDLVRQFGEEYDGFGLLHNSVKEMAPPPIRSKSKSKASTFQILAELAEEYNRHGQVVVRGLEALGPSSSNASTSTSAGPVVVKQEVIAIDLLDDNHKESDRTGTSMTPSKKSTGDNMSRHLAASINQLSHTTLIKLEKTAVQPPRRHRVGLDDLNSAPPIKVEVLSISDPARYFERIESKSNDPSSVASMEGAEDDRAGEALEGEEDLGEPSSSRARAMAAAMVLSGTAATTAVGGWGQWTTSHPSGLGHNNSNNYNVNSLHRPPTNQPINQPTSRPVEPTQVPTVSTAKAQPPQKRISRKVRMDRMARLASTIAASDLGSNIINPAAAATALLAASPFEVNTGGGGGRYGMGAMMEASTGGSGSGGGIGLGLGLGVGLGIGGGASVGGGLNSNGIGTPSSSSSLALSRRSLSGSVPGAISEAEPVPDSLLPASSLDVTASHVIASSLGTTEFVDPLTGHVTRHSLESLTWHRAGLDLDLPEAERESLRHVAALVAGLCRQFWRSIPVREGDASGRQWVERLKDALEKKLVEVKTLSGKASGAERRHVRQLLRPPREMLEAALQRYDMGVCLTDAALARSRPFKA